MQPPFYAVEFYLVGKFAEVASISVVEAYKLSLLAAWLLTGGALLLWTRDRIVICLVLLALLPGSMALGYFDIYLAPPLLVAFYGLRHHRPVLFSLAFSVFALTKGQAAIAVPFVVCFFAAAWFRDRPRPARESVLVIVPAVLALVAVFAVFGADPLRAVGNATANRPWSGYALNLPWLVTAMYRYFIPNEFGGLMMNGEVELIVSAPRHIAWVILRIVFLIAFAGLLVVFVRRLLKARVSAFPLFLRFVFLGYWVYFALNPGVHENHLFYATLAGLILYLYDASFLAAATYTAAAYNINMVLFYGMTGAGLGFTRVFGMDVSVPLATVNLLFLGILARDCLASVEVARELGPADAQLLKQEPAAR